MYEYFDVLLTPLVKNRYNAVDCRIVDLLIRRVTRNGMDDVKDPKLAPLVERYTKMRSDMKGRVDKAYESFCELNPLLAAVVTCVSHNYGSRGSLAGNTSAKDFKRLTRWK